MTSSQNQYFNVLIVWKGYVTKVHDHSFESELVELTSTDDIKEYAVLDYDCIIDFDPTTTKLEIGQCFLYVITDNGHAAKLQR